MTITQEQMKKDLEFMERVNSEKEKESENLHKNSVLFTGKLVGYEWMFVVDKNTKQKDIKTIIKHTLSHALNDDIGLDHISKYIQYELSKKAANGWEDHASPYGCESGSIKIKTLLDRQAKKGE